MTMVQYLLPIATGDPDEIPHESDVMAVDPLSLDDPYSLALRRNRNILNPKKEHASKGRVKKMKTSRSRSGSSNAIRELFTFAPSQPNVGEQPAVDGMRPIVSVSTMSSYSGGNDGSVDNEVVQQSTLRRSKSKGSMSNLRDALASTFGKKKA